MTNKGLSCAFLAGGPENMRQLLRPESRMEALDLDIILEQTRTLILDDCTLGSGDTCLSTRDTNVG